MHLTVSWDDDGVEVDLEVPPHTWARIVSGEKATLPGKGYSYEGEWFQDHWHFSGGLDGDLEVTYESSDSESTSGTGIVCSLEDAVALDSE